MLLYKELGLVYDELQFIREELGDPRLTNLMFYKDNENPAIPRQLEIVEGIKKSNPPPKLVGLETAFGRSHYISQQDIYLKIPRERIERNVYFWEVLIDVKEPTPNEFVGGSKARIVYLDESKAMFYGVVLQVNKDIGTGENING